MDTGQGRVDKAIPSVWILDRAGLIRPYPLYEYWAGLSTDKAVPSLWKLGAEDGEDKVWPDISSSSNNLDPNTDRN